MMNTEMNIDTMYNKFQMVYNEFVKHPLSKNFNLKLTGTNYEKIVKRPIILSDIQRKIEQKKYRTIQNFRDDFILMLSNCIHFTQKDSENHRDDPSLKDIYINFNTVCCYLSDKFNKIFNKYFYPTKTEWEAKIENLERKIGDLLNSPVPRGDDYLGYGGFGSDFGQIGQTSTLKANDNWNGSQDIDLVKLAHSFVDMPLHSSDVLACYQMFGSFNYQPKPLVNKDTYTVELSKLPKPLLVMLNLYLDERLKALGKK